MSAQVHRRSVRVVVAVASGAAAAALVPAVPAAAQAGPSKPAIVHDGTWYLRNSLTSGPATSTFGYGRRDDVAVMGDWDGDGHDTVGVARQTPISGGRTAYTWYLRNSNTPGPHDVPAFVYGEVVFVAVDQLGTVPVVGDWDGDGIDTVGVLRYDLEVDGPMRWQLRNTNAAGPADLSFGYSRGRDVPVAGDWDGDGTDSIGVYRRPNGWLLRNSNDGGNATYSYSYGSSRSLQLPVPGDWDGDGDYTPAVLSNLPPGEAGPFKLWQFRNTNSSGVEDGRITYGGNAQSVSPPIDTVPRLSWR